MANCAVGGMNMKAAHITRFVKHEYLLSQPSGKINGDLAAPANCMSSCYIPNMRAARCFAFIVIVCSASTCVLTLAQGFRGEAVPVVQRIVPVEFSRLRFLTFVFGREGPMDAPITSPPVMGREYFIEADLNGTEFVSSVRFELLDANGRSLQPVAMWKGSDSSTDGEFYGFVTVPNQPFRVAISGTTISGTPFRAALNILFQPAINGPADTQAFPAGISASQIGQLQEMVNTYRQQMRARAAQAAADHPGGVIVFARTQVSAIAYEPLTSPSGNPIGMRLRYSIRFPQRQTITAVPHVFPVYSETTWRGMVTMKPLTGTITPTPQMIGVQSLRDVIVYQAAATYQAGVTYSFSIDMIPDFVFQGTLSGRFCIHEQKFTNRTVWNALVSSSAAIPYSLTISDTGTVANIPDFLPQRTFHESFIAAGAVDCGPVPNIRF